MYKIWTYITEPVGNNEFNYNERIALWSKGKIFVPNLIQWTVADLEEGSEIVFEETNNWELVSCTWLKNFIDTSYKWVPTYIFDNHNHALFFRYRHTAQLKAPFLSPFAKGDAEGRGILKKESLTKWGFKPFVVIHIDQHADTKENKNSFKAVHSSPQEAFGFTNYACNVGNFLTSAKDAEIIDEIIQVRTDYTLNQLWTLNFELWTHYILDIDMDFREQKTDKEIQSDFEIIRKLIDNVCLITIATSPYFMEQKQAIKLIKELLQ